MLETCPSCGAQFLPKPGEPACPHCGEVLGDADDGWDDLEDGWETAEGDDAASGQGESPAGGAASGAAPGPARRKRTRSRGKRRRHPAGPGPAQPGQAQTGQAPAQPGQAQSAKKRHRAPPTAQVPPLKRKRPLPAWLIPVAVLAVAMLVGALALIAYRSSAK